MLALCEPGWARALGDAGGFLPTHMVSRFQGMKGGPEARKWGVCDDKFRLIAFRKKPRNPKK